MNFIFLNMIYLFQTVVFIHHGLILNMCATLSVCDTFVRPIPM